MTNLPFQELTKRLERELYRLHYSESSVTQYRRMWWRITTFFEQEGIDHFTEEAGMHFLDEQFNFFELEKAGKLTQSISSRLETTHCLVWLDGHRPGHISDA
jgi:integrase/recombinase XerD